MLTPIQKNRVYENVSLQIKKQIEEGSWKEGEKINGEIELAKLFQVSRGSIREAIKSLQLQGILEVQNGNGTYVAQNALKKIKERQLLEMMNDDFYHDEIIECRFIIECQAAYLAAKICSQEDIEALNKNYNEMMECTMKGDEKQCSQKGHEFHSYIVKMINNEVLATFYDSILQLLMQERDRFYSETEDEEVLHYHSEHKKLIEAFEKHDAELARSIMEQHLSRKMHNKKYVKG